MRVEMDHDAASQFEAPLFFGFRNRSCSNTSSCDLKGEVIDQSWIIELPVAWEFHPAIASPSGTT